MTRIVAKHSQLSTKEYHMRVCQFSRKNLKKAAIHHQTILSNHQHPSRGPTVGSPSVPGGCGKRPKSLGSPWTNDVVQLFGPMTFGSLGWMLRGRGFIISKKNTPMMAKYIIYIYIYTLYIYYIYYIYTIYIYTIYINLYLLLVQSATCPHSTSESSKVNLAGYASIPLSNDT